MKQVYKTIAQIITGASATLTLWTGKAMAIGFRGGAREGAEAGRGEGMPADLIGDNGIFTRITNTMLFFIALTSVIMLVYGGLRYIISGGDSKKVTDAKNTILYAIIGLIIAILAYAIVNFVLTTIGIPSIDQQQEDLSFVSI